MPATTVYYKRLISLNLASNEINLTEVTALGHRVLIPMSVTLLNSFFYWSRKHGLCRPIGHFNALGASPIGGPSFIDAICSSLGISYKDMDANTSGLNFTSSVLDSESDARLRQNGIISANDLVMAYVLFKCYGNSAFVTHDVVYNLEDVYNMLPNHCLANSIQLSLLVDEAIGPGSYVDSMFTNLMAEDPMRFFDCSGRQMPGLFERNPDASGCGTWKFVVNDKVELPIQLRFTAPVTISSIVDDDSMQCGCTMKTTMVKPGDTFNIRLQLFAVEPPAATAAQEAEAAEEAARIAANAHAAAIAAEAASAAEKEEAGELAKHAADDAAYYATVAAAARDLDEAQDAAAQAVAAAATAEAAAIVADTAAARRFASAAASSAAAASASYIALTHTLCTDSSDDESDGAEGVAISQNSLAAVAATAAAAATTVLEAQEAFTRAATAASAAALAASLANTLVATAAADNAEVKAVSAASSLTCLQKGLADAEQAVLTQTVLAAARKVAGDAQSLVQIATASIASVAASTPECAAQASQSFLATLQTLSSRASATAGAAATASACDQMEGAEAVNILALAASRTASMDVTGAEAVLAAVVAEATGGPGQQEAIMVASASLASKKAIAAAATTVVMSSQAAVAAALEALRVERLSAVEARAIADSIVAMIAASHAVSDASEALRPGASHTVLEDATAEETRAKAAAVDAQLAVGIANTPVTIRALALAQEKAREASAAVDSITHRMMSIPCPVPPTELHMGDMASNGRGRRKVCREGERLLSRLDISGTIDVNATRPYVRARRPRKDSDIDISGEHRVYACSVNWRDTVNKAVVYTVSFYSRTTAGIGCGTLVQTLEFNPYKDTTCCRKGKYTIYSSFPMKWGIYYYATISATNIRGESHPMPVPSSVYAAEHSSLSDTFNWNS